MAETPAQPSTRGNVCGCAVPPEPGCPARLCRDCCGYAHNEHHELREDV